MLGFLKCDAEGCDHQENHEVIGEDLVDKPCPKCGANLLTRRDFEDGRVMLAALRLLESAGLAKLGSDPGSAVPEGHELVTTRVHQGKIYINDKEHPNEQ